MTSAKKNHHRLWIALLCLSVIASLIAWPMRASQKVKYSTITAATSIIESNVTALGTLQPSHYVDVGAQASGQILKRHIEPGDAVEKGQLLVEIDPSTQQANVDASRYSIDILKAQLEDQRAQHQLAEQQHRRQLRLVHTGSTRAEDVEISAAQLRSTKARIAMFQAQINQAEATLRSDEAELGYTRIYAPMSGTVVAVDARVGQTLNAQQQTPLILRIAKLSSMTVWAEVSEADIGRIKTGMPAYFTTLSGNNRRWIGTVRQILPVPPKPLGEMAQSSQNQSESGRVVLYTVLFDVDNHDRALMAEMTTQVFFVDNRAENTLTIPIASLQSPDNDKGLYQVWVVAENQLEQREVRVGIRDRLSIQILEGLNEGEKLLIGPPPVGEG